MSTPTTPLPGDQAIAARRAWAALDVLHVVGYFAPENRAAYKALGLRASLAYFAARSAAMGPVPAPVCTATFYVFSPGLVGAALPDAWSIATPAQVLSARHAGIAAALGRVLDGAVDSDELAEAVQLARTACDGLTPAGRALYAGHAALPWPHDPLMALWHAATLLREHRGDGHVAALLHAPLDPVEALVCGGLAAGNTSFQRASRGWSDQEWTAGEQRLRSRSLLDDEGLTAEGAALRERVEAQTDVAALEGWAHLGIEGTTRLAELVRPWARAVVGSGVIPAEVRGSRRP